MLDVLLSAAMWIVIGVLTLVGVGLAVTYFGLLASLPVVGGLSVVRKYQKYKRVLSNLGPEFDSDGYLRERKGPDAAWFYRDRTGVPLLPLGPGFGHICVSVGDDDAAFFCDREGSAYKRLPPSVRYEDPEEWLSELREKCRINPRVRARERRAARLGAYV